jgi:hypothetical protein
MTPPPLDRATGPKLAFIPQRVKQFQQALHGDECHTHNQQHDVQRTLNSATSS